MDIDGKPHHPAPEPQALTASTMLTPSYQDYLLGRALPAREHAAELLELLCDDSLCGGGMSPQEIEAILAAAAGRLH